MSRTAADGDTRETYLARSDETEKHRMVLTGVTGPGGVRAHCTVTSCAASTVLAPPVDVTDLVAKVVEHQDSVWLVLGGKP